jgi:hypothetical protein
MTTKKAKKPAELCFLSRTYASEQFGTDDHEFAIITLDREFAQRSQARRKLFEQAKKADSSLYEMYYWGGYVEYLDTLDVLVPKTLSKRRLEVLVARLLEGNVIEVPVTYRTYLENNFQRMECEQVVVSEDGVKFVALPKHTNIYVNTDDLSWDSIARLL